MKPIRFDAAMTKLIRENCAAMVDSALKQPNMSTRFNLSVDLKEVLPKYTGKAEVIFSAIAYSKLICMVMHDNREVAVHGSVNRCIAQDPANAGFYVDDIYIYPQEVTTATVEASDAYGYWVARQPDDIFNRMRFQAHSHVSMGVTPSGVDQTFYQKLMVEVQDFYIFLIINKRMEVWCEIYDIENNVLYETADVTTNVAFSDVVGDDSCGFTKTLKELVVSKVYTYPAATEEKKTVAAKAPPTTTPTTGTMGTGSTTTKKRDKEKKNKKDKQRSKFIYTQEELDFMNTVEEKPGNYTGEEIRRYMNLLER